MGSIYPQDLGTAGYTLERRCDWIQNISTLYQPAKTLIFRDAAQ